MNYKFIIITVLFIIFSCEKENAFDEFGLYGVGYAILNDTPWKGKTGIFKAKEYCQPERENHII